MTVFLLVMGVWVVGSFALTLLWIAHRRFIGTHAVEEFDAVMTQWAETEPRPTQRMGTGLS